MKSSICHTVLLVLACSVGVMLHAQFISIPPMQPPPWCPAGTDCGGQVMAQTESGMAEAAVGYRSGQDGIFDRPLILIEGLDFGSEWNNNELGYGNITWGRIHGSDPIAFPLGLDYRPLLDDLHVIGADLLFIDFKHGTSSLEDKACVVKHVLNLVKDTQTGSQPGVLIGVSMGGVVARMALAQFEQGGEPHCIGQYYSIDAPHLGATLPTGLQALILGLSNQSEGGQATWNVLNSIASRQLLQHHIAGSDEHYQAQSALSNLGWPTRSWNLNVINSRPEATASLTPSPLVRIEWGLNSPIETSLFFVQADRWNPNVQSSGASMYLPGNALTLFNADPLSASTYSFPQPLTDVESMAGSQSTHVTNLTEAIKASIPFPVTEEIVQPNSTFISYASALGAFEGQANAAWKDLSQSTLAMPREEHASLGHHHRQWMFDWIFSLWEMPFSEVIEDQSSSVTLGWQSPMHRLIPGVQVHSNGQVVIGNNTDCFETQTSACDGQLSLENGGALHVGYHNGVCGHLNVGSGTGIVVGPGGELHVHSGSKLNLEQFGELTLSGGKLIIHDGGEVRLNQNSHLITEGSGQIELLHSQSKLVVGGSLHVHHHSHLILLSKGQIQWKNDANIAVHDFGEFTLDQLDQGFMTISGETTWSGEGIAMFHGGLVSFEQDAKFDILLQSQWENTEVVGLSGNSCHIHSIEAIEFQSCTFGNVTWDHSSGINPASVVKVYDSEWVHGQINVANARARIFNNNFTHNEIAVTNLAHPSRFKDNRWESPWYAENAALTIEDCDVPVIAESNSWIGGRGLSVENANVVMSCNSWEDCDIALMLSANGNACLSPGCGGGHNRWNFNGTIFSLSNAPLPNLEMGSNHFGTNSEFVLSGTTSSPLETYTIQGASWCSGCLENPWMSPIPCNLNHCNDGECDQISCVASHFVPQSTCEEGGSPKPLSKSRKAIGSFNALGQQVVAQSGGFAGATYLFAPPNEGGPTLPNTP